MILSLRSTLFLAMAATASAEVIDPDWMVAMNMEDEIRANSWWVSLQNTGNPGVEYYATDPNYNWVFDPENVWPHTDTVTGLDCIRLEVEEENVKRSWIKTTVNGVPGAGECDIIESFTLQFNGGSAIPLNDGFYVFVDGSYSGVHASVSSNTYTDVFLPPNANWNTFMGWETSTPIVIPIGGLASASHEIAIAIEEYIRFGGFCDVQFVPTIVTRECDDGDGGAGGDPHVNVWGGKFFDYHGECDLVLAHAPSFGNGLGLDVHIRTKIQYDYSFISSAALRIGEDVLEVASYGSYLLNGVAGAEMPAQMGSFAVGHEQVNKKEHLFTVNLGANSRVVFKTFKNMVYVKFEGVHGADFKDSVGLMGEYGSGRLLARDGETVFEDTNAFGQEWQVLASEPKLFNTDRFPQHPAQKCILPTKTAGASRRLGETIAEEAAEKACAHIANEQERAHCVFDVMATGDFEVAQAGAF